MQSHTDWQRPNLVYFFLCFVVIFEITFLICFRHIARLRIIKWLFDRRLRGLPALERLRHNCGIFLNNVSNSNSIAIGASDSAQFKCQAVIGQVENVIN